MQVAIYFARADANVCDQHHIPIMGPNLESAAEIYVAKSMAARGAAVTYLRFATCDAAVRHAVEVIDLEKFPGTVIEVDDLRLGGAEIADLYKSLLRNAPATGSA